MSEKEAGKGAATVVAEAAPHKHEWKRADDWDWGPDTVTYECVPCRSLRIVRRKVVVR